MSNLALYRKYRSADFDEVVGQGHVVQALQNAIENGKHSHAYLLTGPRGVGKTSVARIIARRLNQVPKNDDLTQHLDIIEIDGASNRGIDEIRNLKEKIQVGPARLQYKVYIIDEVHMLTKDAFNALLKTLEEPPAHVVFIFATTEIQKVPATILSRTQRFDFKPITIVDITKHLRFIADKEKISIDDKALELIAKISRGGFRDAISLLDQVSSFGGKITAQTVAELTGLQDEATTLSIIDSIKLQDPAKVIETLQDLYEKGADPALLAQQMLDLIAQLLLEGDKYETAFLVRLSQDLHWVQTNIRYTTSPQLVLQVGLVRSIVELTKPDLRATYHRPENNKAPSSSIQKEPDISAPQPIKEQSSGITDDEKLLKSLSVIKHYNNSLYAVLKGASISVGPEVVKVKCRFSFHKDRICEHRNTTLIEKAFSKVYGRGMHLECEVDNSATNEKINSDEELLSSAIAILGGEVIDA